MQNVAKIGSTKRFRAVFYEIEEQKVLFGGAIRVTHWHRFKLFGNPHRNLTNRPVDRNRQPLQHKHRLSDYLDNDIWRECVGATQQCID